MNTLELLRTMPNDWLENEFRHAAMVMPRTLRKSVSYQIARKPMESLPQVSREMRHQTAVCRVLGRYLMEIEVDDLGCSTQLAMNGFWKLPITRAIARYVSVNSRAIDVGANVGYYSLLLASVLGCHVKAIDMQEDLCECIARTSCMNGLGIDVELAAVSDKMVEVWFNREDVTANASIGQPAQFSKLCTLAYAEPLDNLIDGVENWSFVKIDVEGHEPEVLRGMKGIIASNPDLQVCLKFTMRLYQDADGFLGSLREYFLVRGINDDGTLREIHDDEVLRSKEFVMLWCKRK